MNWCKTSKQQKRRFKIYLKTKLYITPNFDNNFVAIRKNKVTLNLNKPTYIGMFILELSKVLMYQFHYNNIRSKYYSKSKLLFPDNVNIMYGIKTKDVYEDFSSNEEMFEFSNYST